MEMSVVSLSAPLYTNIHALIDLSKQYTNIVEDQGKAIVYISDPKHTLSPIKTNPSQNIDKRQ